MAEDVPWLHAEPVGLPQGKQRQRDQQTGRNREFTQKNLKRKSSVQYAGVFKKKSLYLDAFITYADTHYGSDEKEWQGRRFMKHLKTAPLFEQLALP